MSVAGLVFGILAIILFWIPLIGWLGILFGLVALTLGGLVLRKNLYRGRGLAALILGGLSVGLGLQFQLWTPDSDQMEDQKMEETFNELEAQLDDPSFGADLQKQLEAIEAEAPDLGEGAEPEPGDTDAGPSAPVKP